MIIGATKENDYQLLSTSQLLYQQYDLKRVFYSAYIPVNEDSALPSRETKPPLLREHRLYQADCCSASTVFRRMNCSMKPTRTSMHSSTEMRLGTAPYGAVSSGDQHG